MNTAQGFLVVVRSPKDALQSSNPCYRGLDRMPPYPTENDAVEEALDEYVFGEYKNEEGVIPSLDLAKELLKRFNSLSQKFELIYTLSCDEARPALQPQEFTSLGFDVACHAPFWSPVGDLPIGVEIKSFRDRLNEHGLFAFFEDAKEYLAAYRSQWLEDSETVLTIWEVYLVK